jgi:hypothetical protein
MSGFHSIILAQTIIQQDNQQNLIVALIVYINNTFIGTLLSSAKNIQDVEKLINSIRIET